MTTVIRIDDKYTVKHEHGANLRTERYGEPWREHVGDGLILAMAQEIESLREYKAWYVEAMCASNAAGYVGLSAAQTITALAEEVTSHKQANG